MGAREQLRQRAMQIKEVFSHRDLTESLIREAHLLLSPIIEDVLADRFGIPDRLPNRQFFYGMHDWELGSQYLGDSELMNAIGELDSALRNLARRDDTSQGKQ